MGLACSEYCRKISRTTTSPKAPLSFSNASPMVTCLVTLRGHQVRWHPTHFTARFSEITEVSHGLGGQGLDSGARLSDTQGLASSRTSSMQGQAQGDPGRPTTSPRDANPQGNWQGSQHAILVLAVCLFSEAFLRQHAWTRGEAAQGTGNGFCNQAETAPTPQGLTHHEACVCPHPSLGLHL